MFLDISQLEMVRLSDFIFRNEVEICKSNNYVVRHS